MSIRVVIHVVRWCLILLHEVYRLPHITWFSMREVVSTMLDCWTGQNSISL